jgi:hypothetical protein
VLKNVATDKYWRAVGLFTSFFEGVLRGYNDNVKKEE